MVLMATAPGAHVFQGGVEYAHGGVSPQESIVPNVDRPVTATHRAVIVAVKWSGLRVRLRAEGGDGLTADLRLGADGEGRSIGQAPPNRCRRPDQPSSPDDTLMGKKGC